MGEFISEEWFRREHPIGKEDSVGRFCRRSFLRWEHERFSAQHQVDEFLDLVFSHVEIKLTAGEKIIQLAE